MGFFTSGLVARVRSSPALFGLTLLGVALGVASALSVQILNRGALGAFQGSVRAVGGDADLSVLPRGPDLPEDLYARVLGIRGVAAAWPVLRAQVALTRSEPTFLDLVGLDLFAPRRLPWREPPKDVSSALLVPGWAAVSPAFAAEMGWSVGDAFEARQGSRRLRLVVGALVDFQKLTPLASPRLVVMDIAQAQALLDRAGSIDEIEVRLEPAEKSGPLARRIAGALGAMVRVQTPEQRRLEAQDLLGAFRLNLTALSLISLFVGSFLVYSSTQASLLRRRGEFGLLRALGATRGQVFGIIVAEALLLGMIGVALGIPLGYAAARINLRSVSATLSNLYLLEEVNSVTVAPVTLLLAALLGLGAALAGAIAPAVEMSRSEHRMLLAGYTLHERIRAAATPLFACGALMLGVAALGYALAGQRWKPGGFVVGIVLLLALPLLAPFLLDKATAWLKVRSLGTVYGARSLSGGLGITAVATAALAVAVCMLVGITVMIASFRSTLVIWIDSTLRADIYISSDSGGRGRGRSPIDPEILARLASRSDVRAVDRLRQTFTECGGSRISVIGVDMALSGGGSRFALIGGNRTEALRKAVQEGAVLLGEPLARKGGWHAGDRIPMVTPQGVRQVPIAGIYLDYGGVRGSAAMDLGTFARLFGPGGVGNVALYLKKGVPTERVVDALRAELAGRGLTIRSNAALRARILSIFEETFAVTTLLRAMSLLTAACGITITLLVLASERLSELALYRALGADRAQIFRVFMGKGLAMGALGIVMGLAGGMALALILVYGVNRSYFGWTLSLHLPALDLAGEILLILLVGILSSLYPALRASATPATELSRDDL